MTNTKIFLGNKIKWVLLDELKHRKLTLGNKSFDFMLEIKIRKKGFCQEMSKQLQYSMVKMI